MVGDSIINKNLIVIYSTIELVNGNSAGSARVMNYARALSESCDVILVSFKRLRNISIDNLIEIEPNIYTVGQKLKSNKFTSKLFYYFRIFYFLIRINKLLKSIDDSKSKTLLFYPTVEVFVDYISVAYLIKYKRLKIIYEANEVRKYSSDLEKNPNGIKSRYLKIKYSCSEKLTKYFKGIICISTGIEKYFRKYNSNTIVIPILSNLTFKIGEKELSYKTSDIFRIGFFGSISFNKENLQLFLETLHDLKKTRPNLNFVVEFYGSIDKVNKSKLYSSISKLELDKNIYYKGQVLQKNVISLMKHFHLLVLPRGNTLQNHYGFSTKLSEYLQSGTPCLVTNVSDNALYIVDNKNGFIVEPDDKHAMLNKLIFIMENYETYCNKIVNYSLLTVKRYFYYKNYSTILKNYLCSIK